MTGKTKKTKLTEFQISALRVIRNHGPIMPGEFAEKMWPDSPAWGRYHNCGHGATAGGGMRMCGGSYIGKLYKKGWVKLYIGNYYERTSPVTRYELTDEGKRLLKEATSDG